MEDAAKEELKQRIRENGWTQGSFLPARHDLFLADLRVPITSEAQQLREAEGEAPLAVVHSDHDDDLGMIVVSQRCDLVASPDTEPLCEAIPLTRLPKDLALPGPNSPRYFVVDAQQRLIADQTRKLEFEKAMLPDGEPKQLLTDEGAKLKFRAWCGRRYTRMPLPDDFNLTVGRAITYVLGKRGRSTAAELTATFPWRVLRDRADDDSIEVAVLVPYDEEHEAAEGVAGFVDEVMSGASDRLPNEQRRAERWGESRGVTIRKHQIVGYKAIPADVVTLRDILDSDALDLEYLTYGGDEVEGVLPIEDQLA